MKSPANQPETPRAPGEVHRAPAPPMRLAHRPTPGPPLTVRKPPCLSWGVPVPNPGGISARTCGEADVRGANAAQHRTRPRPRPGRRMSTRLVCRRHVDLCRTSSAICPSSRA
ncbi:putative leader peptide [Streptomyces sp. NPDC057695]|uniref:putative leader peptide n=1 Tax=Streptomyces sp. NPDC057695 TaxID=3346217 RepID=UPI003692CB6C